jgi:hypothetical protein
MRTRRTFVSLALALGTIVVSGGPSGAASGDAKVTAVTTTGSAGAYTFDVTIASNDTGCDHYVDWWEVVDENGALVYRRILLHDHADEQPFTRDGGPAKVRPDQVVTVRAHVNTSGYAAAAMRGSVQAGFKAIQLPAGYAAALAKEKPLPDVC